MESHFVNFRVIQMHQEEDSRKEKGTVNKSPCERCQKSHVGCDVASPYSQALCKKCFEKGFQACADPTPAPATGPDPMVVAEQNPQGVTTANFNVAAAVPHPSDTVTGIAGTAAHVGPQWQEVHPMTTYPNGNLGYDAGGMHQGETMHILRGDTASANMSLGPDILENGNWSNPNSRVLE